MSGNLFDPTWQLAQETIRRPEAQDLLDLDRGNQIVMHGGLTAVHYSIEHTKDGTKAFNTARNLELNWMQQQLINRNRQGVRFGNTFYRIKEPGEWRIKNWQALTAFITANAGDEAHLAWASLFPARAVRVTALRSLAERWGHTPEAATDSFLEWHQKDDPRKLTPVPINKAPKFAQRLDEGETWPKK